MFTLSKELCSYWPKKEDFLNKLEPFIHHVEAESAHLHQLIKEKDRSATKFLLHKLKGGVKLYGANRLFGAIEQLENVLEKVSNEFIDKAVEEFDVAVSEIVGL